MPFPLPDIEAVCLQIGRSKRAEGENAFPPIAILEEMLDTIGADRARAARKQAEQDEIANWEEHKRLNPEEYAETPELRAQMDRLNARLAMTPERPLRRTLESRLAPLRPERDEAARELNWAKMEQFRAEHGKTEVAA